MPKSRNRKEHKKKSVQRTKEIKFRKEKEKKDFVELMKNAQEEYNKKMVEKSNENVEIANDTIVDVDVETPQVVTETLDIEI